MTMTTAEWVLIAIDETHFYEHSGADVAQIIEYVDFHERLRLTPTQVEAALKRLSKQERILKRGEKYFPLVEL